MLISFAQPRQVGDAYAKMTDDGLLFAVDLVIVVTGKDRNQAARDLRDLPEDIFKSTKIVKRRLNNQGGHCTKLVKFEDAIELIMALPGKRAKRIRKQFADIIARYLDGDRSMCTEVEKNNAMGKFMSYSKFANGVMQGFNAEEEQRANEMPRTCYIYGTKSAAYPGLIKIGKTGDLRARVMNLKTATAPAPHVIVAVAPTFDSDRDETFAKTFLSERRREGEFFEINEAETSAFFATYITAKYNIELAQHIARLQGMHL
jgi:hypothetical protein